jgi:hypothetical protein
VSLPVAGKAIHLRLHLSDQPAGVRIQAIELIPAKDDSVLSDFSALRH